MKAAVRSTQPRMARAELAGLSGSVRGDGYRSRVRSDGDRQDRGAGQPLEIEPEDAELERQSLFPADEGHRSPVRRRHGPVRLVPGGHLDRGAVRILDRGLLPLGLELPCGYA